ncbi:MAG: hypothetical protein FD149_1073 [Rhodospirillaceae bacterium]|nr:MAG: hypothetical protein FD149_1073 [Rhodospirillaceae bacterium]
MEMKLIERIRERAYQLWEAEGCEHGRDMEYWFRAEAQIAGEQADEQAPAQPPQAISATETIAEAKPKSRGKTETRMETDTAAAIMAATRKRSKKV